jgi:hypothetical protein
VRGPGYGICVSFSAAIKFFPEPRLRDASGNGFVTLRLKFLVDAAHNLVGFALAYSEYRHHVPHKQLSDFASKRVMAGFAHGNSTSLMVEIRIAMLGACALSFTAPLL